MMPWLLVPGTQVANEPIPAPGFQKLQGAGGPGKRPPSHGHEGREAEQEH